MDITTFKYSKTVGIGGMVTFICSLATFVFLGFNEDDNTLLLYFYTLEIIIIILIVYFAKKCFIPAIKNEIALTLDEEKVTFHITGRVIYWKDVIEISFDSSRYSTYLSFELMPDNKTIGLGLKWIADDNQYIYDLTLEYFEQSLRTDGQLGYTKDYSA